LLHEFPYEGYGPGVKFIDCKIKLMQERTLKSLHLYLTHYHSFAATVRGLRVQ